MWKIKTFSKELYNNLIRTKKIFGQSLCNDQAQASFSVILGEIFIYDISLYALIDSNTMYFFASLVCVEKLDKQTKALDIIYCIIILSGDIMYLSQGLAH